MKIVFFVQRYWPHVGGVEGYVHHLARALQKLGHRIDVVTGESDPLLPENDEHEGIAIHRFPISHSLLRGRAWMWQQRHLFSNADVIQVSGADMLDLFFRMVGFSLNRRKVFLTRHGMAFDYPVPEEEKLRARRALNKAAGVVHDGKYLERWLGVTPDLCPEPGLDPETCLIEQVAEPPPDSAVYLGRLEPDTGIRVYLEAVRILNRDRHAQFRLDVYGDGSLAHELLETVQHHRLPVIFYGNVPNAAEHIGSSCFAFVDARLSIQESMARKRCVIAAYDNPLKRDYLCGESFSPHLIAVGRARDVAETVQHLSRYPAERARQVASAFDYARTLCWSRTAACFLEFWERRLDRLAAVRRNQTVEQVHSHDQV